MPDDVKPQETPTPESSHTHSIETEGNHTHTIGGGVETPPDPPAAETKPGYSFKTADGTVLTDPEKITAYMRDLENKALNSRLETSVEDIDVAPPAPQVDDPGGKKDYTNLILEDADKAVKQIKDDVINALDERDERKKAQASFWQGFYGENKDLQKMQPIVESTWKEMMQTEEFRKLKLSDAKKVVAERVRKVINLVKGDGGTETELPPGPAAGMTGASGSPAPKVEPPAQPKSSFVEEFKSWQRKRRAG